MPKTFRNLYDQLCRFEHLLEAYRRARRGKRRRPDVAAFEFRYDEYLHQLAEQLRDGSYRPGAYRSFTVTKNGKRRVISTAPFRDRVVHHALCALLEPIYESRFIHDFLRQPPRQGTYAALDRAPPPPSSTWSSSSPASTTPSCAACWPAISPTRASWA